MELLVVLFVYVCVAIFATLKCRSVLNPVSVALAPLATAVLILCLDPLGYDYRTIDIVTAMLLILYGLAMGLPYLVSPPRGSYPRLIQCGAITRCSYARLRIVGSMLLGVGLVGYALKLKAILGSNNVVMEIASALQFVHGHVSMMETSLRQGWSLVHYTGYLGLVYVAYAFALDPKSRPVHNLAVGALCALYLLSLAGLFIKVQFVIGILLFLFTYAILNGRGWRSMALATISIGIVATMIDNYMYSGNLTVSLEFALRYISGSIIGLDNYLAEQSITQSLGANTLQPIYFLLERIGVDTDYSAFNRFYVISDVGTAVNTGTILRDPYLDYGVFGTLIFMLGLSIISRYIMVKFRAGYSLTYVLLYAVILCVLFLGFIGGVYTHIEFVLLFALHGVITASGLIRAQREGCPVTAVRGLTSLGCRFK